MTAGPFDDTVAIIGRRGSGKTYTAKGAVEPFLAAGLRVSIIDPTGVWWGLRLDAAGTAAKFPVVVFGGTRGDVPISETAGSAVAELVAKTVRQSVVDVSEMTIGARMRFVRDFLETLYHVNRDPLRLVIDEADLFAPQRPTPDATVLLSRVEAIARRGRVRGFFPWLITQRPAELHKSVLSQADTLVALRLTAPQDRAAFMAWVEHQADRDEGKKIDASLPTLKKGEGWLWSPEIGILERRKFPPIESFDSSATPGWEHTPAADVQTHAIDVEAIRTALAEEIDRAQENDPKTLRARIAELELRLEETPPAAEEVEREAYGRGYQDGRAAASARQFEVLVTEKRAEGTTEVVARLAFWPPAAGGDHAALDGFPSAEDDAEEAGESVELMQAAHAAAQARGVPTDLRVDHNGLRVAVTEATKRLLLEPGPTIEVGAQIARRLDREIVTGNKPTEEIANLGAGERRVLIAIAQHSLHGVTREALTVLTGYRKSSRDTYLQRLRAQGLAQQSVDAKWIVTPLGLAALGPDFKPLPRGAALRAHWIRELPTGESSVLTHVIGAHPRAIARDKLSDLTGYKKTSRDTYLQRLRARGLVESEGSAVRAARILFEG